MNFGSSFNLTLKKAKTFFFDRERVLKDAGLKTVRALSRFGAFVRQRARSSMRPGGKRGKTSPPGVPPRTHVGHLKRLLFFSWDPATRSVVIGPIKFRQGVVPSLLEFGGTVKGKRRGVMVRMRYRGNPYMRPALDKELPNMPKAWATALRGS